MRDNADFWRRGELEPIGVVDIGSNSVRLVVYEGAVRSPTPIFNEKVLCGLGRQVASTGRLGAESVERALAALARFRAINRILRVKNVRAIATAACREATDGPDFIVRGEAVLGAPIQVLSGEREAELAAKGIMMGFRAPDGVAGDLGGGSLELIDINVDTLRQAATLAARRFALDRYLRRPDRQGRRPGRRAGAARSLVGGRARSGLLRGRRYLAGHRPAAHGGSPTIPCA